jgi:thymidylate synthase ThyX
MTGAKLVTMVVRFPRFVLAEFNTHRVFSRNSASSRAIPVEKQLSMLRESPFAPFEWRSERSGMQGGEELLGDDLLDAQKLWSEVYESTLSSIERYIEKHPDKQTRMHKSIMNRLLEPFMYHTVVVTSSDWENFFDQRCSELAQPEIRVAAEMMRDVLSRARYELVKPGEWHTPFVQPDERNLPMLSQMKVSVARSARVSYLNHDGSRILEKDFQLFDRLASDGHWSPFEHVATPHTDISHESIQRGNFKGWNQLRHSQKWIGELRRNS